ncbi:sugar phosphate isomerase/epimerase family protein [Paenibacillus glycinis]|uniref:TIM barrel protein n=1 Tax=Paenibacillus glycinis TaxID=2697035 RepID=A0ABW9XZK1_9BACL|nr:TIM barrel protein [Paenibacillus glycinis]NBD28162.1 TIM barrel protein [Paenibacillus glycinis]
MKLSIGGYSFHNSRQAGIMDIFGYLESAKFRYRLDAVDLWNGFFASGNDDGLVILPDEDYIRKIRKAVDDRGLTVANIALDGVHLVDPDPARRERLYRNALLHLRASEMLGAKTVRIDICTNQTEEIDERDFDYIVKRYREYCDRGAEFGYTVGPENHMGAALNPHLLKRIAEAVDRPNFGILLHLKRWKPEHAGGDEIVAPWTVHAHVDAKTVIGGEAGVSVRALEQAGYRGYWAIEYNAEANQYEEIEWMLAAVRRLFYHRAES